MTLQEMLVNDTTVKKSENGLTIGRFTRFDDPLTSISWIDTSASFEIDRSKDFCLDGPYSCKFTAAPGGLGATLQTIDLAVPPDYSEMMILYAGYPDSFNPHMTAQVLFDSKPSEIKGIELRNTGAWVNQIVVTFPVPAGAQKAKVILSLRPEYHSSSTQIAYITNLGIYFEKPIEMTYDNAIFSDICGTVSSHSWQDGREIWDYSTQYGFLTSKPAVVDGIAYFGDGDTQSNLYALRALSGEVVFITPLPGGIDATPEITATSVFITTSKGYLYELDKASGLQKNSYNILNLSSGQLAKMYSNKLVRNIIYMSSDKGVFGFDINTKKVVWDCPTASAIECVPVILDDNVYFGGLDGFFYAVNVPRQVCLWEYQTNGPIHSSPRIVDGLVIFGSDDGNLYALNLENGQLVWKISNPGNFIRSFSLDANRLYLAGNSINGTMWAYNVTVTPQTPMPQYQFAPAWSLPITNGTERPPLFNSNLMCFESNDRTCYCLNAADGSLVWKERLEASGFNSPALVYTDPVQMAARRYDQFCYLTAHNAFGNINEGWWAMPNQTFSIIEMLNRGVRGLMLDIYKQNIGGKDQIVFCHSKYYCPLLGAWHYLSDTLIQICRWLENNPSEIVTIQFESYVKDPALIQKTFDDCGATPYIFFADRENRDPTGRYIWGPVLQEGWPSVGVMGALNKRLVVLCESKSEGLPYVWDYVVETKYGDDSLKGSFAERGESANISMSKYRSLYTVNYFPTFNIGNINDNYNFLNTYDKLIGRTRVCEWNPRFWEPQGIPFHRPNFLAVDFVTLGKDGGPLRAVKKINQEWSYLLNQ